MRVVVLRCDGESRSGDSPISDVIVRTCAPIFIDDRIVGIAGGRSVRRNVDGHSAGIVTFRDDTTCKVRFQDPVIRSVFAHEILHW